MYLVSRTVDFAESAQWRADVELEDEVGYMNRRWNRTPKWLHRWVSLWFPIQFSLRLLRKSPRYDGFCVGRYGYWFPPLYRAFGGRKPVVLIDSEWRGNVSRRSGRLNRLAVTHSDFICCNTMEEVLRYSSSHGLPVQKFRHVRMAFQPFDLVPSSDEGYVFAGGTQGRDWETLFAAVEGLPYTVKIFTNTHFDSLPRNVEVRFVTRPEYYRHMAGASCVVIPLHREPLRITGTTSFINAMAMGKVVVVTEPYGAKDYMRHGMEGFFCDYGDVGSVRNYILELMSNPELRTRIGVAARARALAEFSPEVHRQGILMVLQEAEQLRRHV